MKAAPHSNGNPFNSFAQPPRLRRPSRFGLPVLLGLLLLGLVGQAKAQSAVLEHEDVLNLTFYVGVEADYTLPQMAVVIGSTYTVLSYNPTTPDTLINNGEYKGLLFGDSPSGTFVITGAPTAILASKDEAVRVSVDVGNQTPATLDITLRITIVQPQAPEFPDSLGPFAFVENTLGYQDVSATGSGSVFTYSFSPALPANLSLVVDETDNSATLTVLAGTGTAADTDYTLTATDVNGNTDSIVISIQVLDGRASFKSDNSGDLLTFYHTFYKGTPKEITLPTLTRAKKAARYRFFYQNEYLTLINTEAQPPSGRGFILSPQGSRTFTVTSTTSTPKSTDNDYTYFTYYGYYTDAYALLNNSGTADGDALRFAFRVLDTPSALAFTAVQPNLTFGLGAIATHSIAGAQNGHPAYSLTTGMLEGDGYEYTLTRKDGNALPASLVFDAATLEITSTTAISASVNGSYTLTATDETGASITADFRIDAVPGPSFDTVGPFVYVNTATTAQNNITPANGVGKFTYSITPALPSGITFANTDDNGVTTGGNNTLQLVGASGATAQGATDYTLTVTDANGASDSVTISIEIVSAITAAFAESMSAITYVAGIAKEVTLPEATDATLNYPLLYEINFIDITDLDDAGFVTPDEDDFVPAPFIIASDTNTAVNAGVVANLNVAYNYLGETASTLITFIVAAAPNFATAQTDVHFTAGFGGAISLETASGGAGTFGYTLARINDADGVANTTVPDELTLNAATAELTAASTIATSASGSYTLTATDADGNFETANFAITIAEQLAFDPTSATRTVPLAEAVYEFEPPSGGRADLTFSLTSGGSTIADGGGLGTGTTLWTYSAATSTAKAKITGTPTAAGDTLMTYTATDANGASVNFILTITAANVLAFTSAQADVTFVAGHKFTYTLNEAVGGAGQRSYDVIDPAGVSIHQSNSRGIKFLSGTRGLRSANIVSTADSGQYTLRAVSTGNPRMTFETTFNIHVAEALAFSPSTAERGFALSATGISITLANANGGALPIVYELYSGSATAIADGGNVAFVTNSGSSLLYTAANGDTPATLTGNAPSSTDSMMLTYTAEGALGEVATFELTVRVSASPTFPGGDIVATYSVGASTYSIGGMQYGDAITLPAATGGSGSLNYAESGALPGALTRTNVGDAIILSGTPTAAGNFTFARTATDTNSASGEFTFIATVRAAPSIAGSQSAIHATVGGVALNVDFLTSLTASGGFAPFAYSITPTLPGGLQLDAATAKLSGTANNAANVGSAIYTFTATDVHGATATSRFTLEVHAALTFAAGNNPPDTTYTVARNTALTFLAVTGGRPAITYSIDGIADIVSTNSLAFDAAERILSGDFDAVSNDVGLTYVATDNNGATLSYDFNIAAVAAPNFAAADITTLTSGYTFRVGTAIAANFTLPQAQNGLPPITYKLTEGASSTFGMPIFTPPGLAFDRATRILSGIPTAAGDHSLNYHARDANRSTVSQATNMFIAASFTLSQTAVGWATGQAVDTELSEAVGGVGTIAYTVTGLNSATLPSGVTFSATARALQGTPTALANEMTFEYKATDGFDGAIATATFTIQVTENPVFTPPNIAATYSVGATSYTIDGAQYGDAITLPAAVGGVGALAYTDNSGDLGGITRTDGADDTIIISGMPTTVGDYTFTRVATDTSATPRVGTFSLTVNVVAAPSFDSPQPALESSVGVAFNATLQSASGGYSPVVVTLTPDAPLGITRTGSTLSGTPATGATTGDIAYTLTATDAHGATATSPFVWTVYGKPVFADDALDEVTFTVGANKITELPAATGGRAPLTYALDVSGIPVSHTLVFNQANHTLSGTINAAIAGYFVRLNVTDANGATAQHTIALRTAAAPTFSVLEDDTKLTFALGSTPNYFTPQVSDGAGKIVYSMRNLPRGLSYNAEDRKIVGVATAVGITTNSTLTARDENGMSASITLEIYIASAPTFTPPALTVAYTVGGSRYVNANGVSTDDVLTLPAARGFTGTSSYRDNDNLPDGLTFDVTGFGDGRGIIRGTPTVADTFNFTRVAYDNVGDDIRTGTFTLTVIVAPAPKIVGGLDDLEYSEGRSINFTFDSVLNSGGGTKPLTYALLDSDGNPLTNVLRSLGLAFDTRTGILSGRVNKTYAQTAYSFVVTDANGVSASYSDETVYFEFVPKSTLTIAPDVVDYSEERTLVATVNITTFNVTVEDAPDNAVYELNGEVPGLTFDIINNPLKVTVEGTPTTAGVYALTYIVGNPRNINVGGEGVLTVRIIGPPRFAAGQQYIDIQTGEQQSTPLPRASGGVGVLTYSLDLTGAPDWMDKPFEDTTKSPQIGSNAGLDDYDKEAAAGTVYTFQYTVTDSNGATDTLMLIMKLSTTERYIETNKELLSKVAVASVAGTLGAITDRIAAGGGAVIPSASIGGQSPMMALATHLKSLADGNNASAIELPINDSEFNLPLSSLNDNYGGGIWSTAAFWGSANYRRMAGDNDGLDWHGDVTGVHLGFDAMIYQDLLFGVAFSRTGSDMEYTFLTDDDSGDYEITMNSIHPYLNWQVENVSMWMSIGSGEGDLIVRSREQELRGDLGLSAFGVGFQADMSPQLQVRAEWRTGKLEVQGNADRTLEQQEIAAKTTRLALKWHDDNRIGDGSSGFMEVGARGDGGDGASGAALETTLGWQYRGLRSTFEGGVHGFFGRSDYREWGAYGNFRTAAGDDGQGWAVNIRPSYGDAQTEFGRVWDAQSIEDIDGDGNGDADYAWRTESRLSYGVQSASGLVAPFGEIIAAEQDIYRLGVDWSPHRYFDVNLTGEQRTDEQRLLLQGEVKF